MMLADDFGELGEDFDGCMVPASLEAVKKASPWTFDIPITIAPIVLPAAAGLLYAPLMQDYHALVDILANQKWVAVDGGISQVESLLPLVNGIVVPSCSFVLGALTAMTISTLRTRQERIRILLNKEACLINCMLASIQALYQAGHDQERRLKGLMLLRAYTVRVLAESSFGIDIEELERIGASDSELDGLLSLLLLTPNLDLAENSNAPTAFASPPLVREMMMARSDRLALLQTTYPTTHWAIMTVLASSIIGAFLFESDQGPLQFLNMFQLRILFAVLSGAMVGIATLCLDLSDPFRGSFKITSCTKQLYVIRATMDLELDSYCK